MTKELMTMNKFLHPTNKIKKWTRTNEYWGLRRYINTRSRGKSKENLIAEASDINSNMRTNRKTPKATKIENWNGKKKQFYGHFKRQTAGVAHEKAWAWKEKPPERNWISFNSNSKQCQMTNYTEAITENTHQNNKCTSCGNRAERFKHVLETKITKYKTRQNGVRKMVHWKLWKRLKFKHSNKCYMHKPESLQENDTHEIIRDFKILDLIFNTRSDLQARIWQAVSLSIPSLKIRSSID